jgi:hypothetical protein
MAGTITLQDKSRTAKAKGKQVTATQLSKKKNEDNKINKDKQQRHRQVTA